MILAIISDLHANASAFKAVLSDARARGAEKIVCLGDVVGYGPLPEETTTLARQSCAIVLSGNHDDAVCGKRACDDFNDLARDAVLRHREVLSKENLDWLRSLPSTYAGETFAASHADFTDPSSYRYMDEPECAADNFRATEEPILFVGHTHEPGIFVTGASGRVYAIPPADFTLEPGKRYIVNPGSVGYPRERDGVCRSSYVLYDPVRREVRFVFLPFNVSSVMQRGSRTRRAWPMIVGLCAVALLIALGLNWCNRPKRTEPSPIACTAPTNEVTHVFRFTTNIALSVEQKFLHPNLDLATKNVPVFCETRFSDANGQLTEMPRTNTFRTQFTKALRIPAGSLRAEFILTSEGLPRIKSFAPLATATRK